MIVLHWQAFVLCVNKWQKEKLQCKICCNVKYHCIDMLYQRVLFKIENYVTGNSYYAERIDYFIG